MKRGPCGPFLFILQFLLGRRILFDKTRQRFGRASAASAPRRGENRPEPVRVNPLGSAEFVQFLSSAADEYWLSIKCPDSFVSGHLGRIVARNS